MPVLNGGLFSSRRAEAMFRAQVADQARDGISRTASRGMSRSRGCRRTGYQRLDLTSQLLAQATDALDLAQPRYDLGLSSIVELTQAQLNKTEAEIAEATARYDYQASVRAEFSDGIVAVGRMGDFRLHRVYRRRRGTDQGLGFHEEN